MQDLSIVIPAKNEAGAIGNVLEGLRESFPDAEIIVVDDGSDDDTGEIAGKAGATTVIRHETSQGNGAAVKAGVRAASRSTLAMMDADGQHAAGTLVKLVDLYKTGLYDMVIGARSYEGHANNSRFLANFGYNKLASLMTGRKIPDLTSGLRVVDAAKFRQFMALLPNGFSYPTTITMAFLRTGYRVHFENVNVARRHGKSHIRPIQDGLRFLLIILRIGTLYAPMKLFLPLSLISFLVGSGYYVYTFSTIGRFTNMSALILSVSVLIFLIGLLAEQITTLTYVTLHASLNKVEKPDDRET